MILLTKATASVAKETTENRLRFITSNVMKRPQKDNPPRMQESSQYTAFLAILKRQKERMQKSRKLDNQARKGSQAKSITRQRK